MDAQQSSVNLKETGTRSVVQLASHLKPGALSYSTKNRSQRSERWGRLYRDGAKKKTFPPRGMFIDLFHLWWGFKRVNGVCCELGGSQSRRYCINGTLTKRALTKLARRVLLYQGVRRRVMGLGQGRGIATYPGSGGLKTASGPSSARSVGHPPFRSHF